MLDEIRLESGFFDRTFFMYFEDVDLGWRGRLAGWSAVYEPRAVVHHAVGEADALDLRAERLAVTAAADDDVAQRRLHLDLVVPAVGLNLKGLVDDLQLDWRVLVLAWSDAGDNDEILADQVLVARQLPRQPNSALRVHAVGDRGQHTKEHRVDGAPPPPTSSPSESAPR